MDKTLTFIWHDCFVFEDKNCIIVFDFWKDKFLDNNNLPLFLNKQDKTKSIFVFVSHHHKDHFNRSIFEWEKYFPNIHFILSKDVARHCRYLLRPESIYKGYKPNPDKVFIVSSGDHITFENLKVNVFGSTDIGNSYVVEVEGIKIFHAGDLNAWIWKDESTIKEVESEIKKFRDILEKIKEKFSSFDLVMFPVDPRLGTDFFEGARIFVNEFHIAHFFPMHFCLWENEEQKLKFLYSASNFKEYANPDFGEYIALLSPYSSFGF